MSRKNLDEHGRLRSKTVAFRVSPEESRKLDAIVAMSGLTKQDYIVARLLCQEVTVVPSSRVQKGMEEGMQMVYCEILRLGEGDEVQPEVLDVIRLLAALFEGFGGGGAPTAHCSPRDALLHMERGD